MKFVRFGLNVFSVILIMFGVGMVMEFTVVRDSAMVGINYLFSECGINLLDEVSFSKLGLYTMVSGFLCAAFSMILKDTSHHYSYKGVNTIEDKL